MEEKLIDLDKGKTIRLKKTAEGDTEILEGEELSVETDAVEEAEDEEVVFEMPEGDEDNEELASLSKEEAQAYYKAQLQKAKEMEEKGRAYLADAKECEAEGDFRNAYLSFKEAHDLLGAEPEIVVGVLRNATASFTEVENLQGLDAYVSELSEMNDEVKESFRTEYGEAVKETLAKINEERDPLKEKVEQKREARGEKFGRAYRKATRNLIITGSVSIVFLILTAVFFNLVYSRSDQLFLLLGIISAAVFLVSLIVTLFFVKFFVNARNRVVMNADNAYSNDGRRLNVLTEQYEFYNSLANL
ncbi:MAG: hypothetical protein J6D37_05030 [Clostridia bacterium]|nr:hypothetical protein [Clostridia bacterium]